MPAGPSILETYWARLDELVAAIMHNGYNARASAEAFGIAWCIAVMTNPYDPDVSATRTEAMRRYADR
jgi:hypothetical protein